MLDTVVEPNAKRKTQFQKRPLEAAPQTELNLLDSNTKIYKFTGKINKFKAQYKNGLVSLFM